MTIKTRPSHSGSTRYQLEAGKIDDEAGQTMKARLLMEVDIDCPDCSLTGTYPDWTKLSEPLYSYCKMIFDQEYA